MQDPNSRPPVHYAVRSIPPNALRLPSIQSTPSHIIKTPPLKKQSSSPRSSNLSPLLRQPAHLPARHNRPPERGILIRHPPPQRALHLGPERQLRQRIRLLGRRRVALLLEAFLLQPVEAVGPFLEVLHPGVGCCCCGGGGGHGGCGRGGRVEGVGV